LNFGLAYLADYAIQGGVMLLSGKQASPTAGTVSAARRRRGCPFRGTIAIVAAVLAGCDPGPVSPAVSLLRNDSGSLFVVGNTCNTRLAAIEFGEGSDFGSGKVAATVEPTDQLSGWFQVDITDLSRGFELTTGSVQLTSLTAPFFVRFRTDDGLWAAQVFDSLPDNGRAISTPDGTTDGRVEEIPADKIPASLSDCPDVVRQFTPGSE
jgi:hypothetical protein